MGYRPATGNMSRCFSRCTLAVRSAWYRLRKGERASRRRCHIGIPFLDAHTSRKSSALPHLMNVARAFATPRDVLDVLAPARAADALVFIALSRRRFPGAASLRTARGSSVANAARLPARGSLSARRCDRQGRAVRARALGVLGRALLAGRAALHRRPRARARGSRPREDHIADERERSRQPARLRRVRSRAADDRVHGGSRRTALLRLALDCDIGDGDLRLPARRAP